MRINDLKRREFVALLGSAAAAWPTVARGQERRLPVIGLLSGFAAGTSFVENFHRGLKESGFVEGQNVAIDYRSADGQYDRLPELAADLINKRVSVIATLGENAALAVKAARTAVASKIPFVFSLGEDPVALGLVPSLNRPDENITGATSISQSLELKRLELLREFVPDATLIAVLVNPNIPREFELKNVEDVARRFGLRLLIVHASAAGEFDSVFTTLVTERVGALIIIGDTYFSSQSDKLGSLAFRHAIPAVYATREFVSAGGLLSYGTSIADTIRQAGIYTGKILAGTRPADLPVMQPTRFQFVINLKTAKALGLTVPQSILLRADEVIE
jgi:putative tryptophan/tyrosine transport system substrate-binding protein